MEIQLIGAAIDQCAGIAGAQNTPEIINSLLKNNSSLVFSKILYYDGDGHNIDKLATYYTNLANAAYIALENKNFPIIVGGDHSCAIGTWSGISKYLIDNNQSLGLIWIDAHMDSHTPETTPSGNIHGMPVATLLGYGYSELISILEYQPKINPTNVILIGIRSFEDDEARLLAKLGVKIYYNHEVIEHGFATVFIKAWQDLSNKVNKIGLSIDVDGFDPDFTPGVGTRESHGIDFNHFMHEFNQLDMKNLIGLEITEANSHLDIDNKTIDCVLAIIKTTYNKLIAN